MRYCKYCGEDKPHDAKAKLHSKASGFMGARCWSCYKARMVIVCAKIRSTESGRIKTNATSAKHNAKIRATPAGAAKFNAASRASKKNNPGACNAARVAYEQSKAKRIPPWANLEAIKAIYQEAAIKGLTVDHVVPLRGKYVSGLHVENNLQLLTKSENSRKGNNYENIFSWGRL